MFVSLLERTSAREHEAGAWDGSGPILQVMQTTVYPVLQGESHKLTI